jgi:hypothetical protein
MRILRTLLVTSLLVTGAACGGDGDTSDTTAPDSTTTEPTTPATEPTTPATEPTTPSTEPTTPATEPTAPATEPADLVDVRIYLLRDERLVIAHRDVEGPAVLRGALTALLSGPDDVEDDLLTTVPDGTRLLGVNLVDGTATVDLSGEFDDGGGTLSMTARVAQVVFTATQFGNVDEVVFWLDGEPIEYLGGEGLIMDEAWTRADISRELSGSVIFDSPTYGATVSSPFVVTGEADVYEAQFPIEIRRDGDTILTIAPVTGGAWGRWADFAITVTLDIEPGAIDIVGYDEGGCGDDPDCPPIIETVLALHLS